VQNVRASAGVPSECPSTVRVVRLSCRYRTFDHRKFSAAISQYVGHWVVKSGNPEECTVLKRSCISRILLLLVRDPIGSFRSSFRHLETCKRSQMPRLLKVAAAQMGPVHLTSPRRETLLRMITLLESASSLGAKLVLFPETAFTTFFPRHLIASQEELDSYFEPADDLLSSSNTSPLFDEAKNLGIDVSVGFAERTTDGKGFNTSVYYSAKKGEVIAKYRKVHLPGTKEPFENPDAINQLEKRYFEPGNLGFQAFRVPDIIDEAAKKSSGAIEVGKGDPIMGMIICNDRRWPEAWRCYGLQGVEVILCGYNTAGFAPDLWGTKRTMTPKQAEDDAVFHHRLVMQANSYMNSTFSICAAKAGK
jgi:predicted amidohydrolase